MCIAIVGQAVFSRDFPSQRAVVAGRDSIRFLGAFLCAICGLADAEAEFPAGHGCVVLFRLKQSCCTEPLEKKRTVSLGYLLCYLYKQASMDKQNREMR